jgi:protein-tyrosine sulfotransferase
MGAPIFLLSDFRSGSTLLRYVLDAHPSVCCPAELRLAAFCQSVFKVVDLTMVDGPSWRDGGGPQRVEVVRRIVDQVMDAYCLRKGKLRWCDKSPANTEILYVLTAVFADAQYVCLYRNALDQVHSALEVNGPEWFNPYLTRHGGNVVAAAIDRWCSKTERLLAFEHAHRGRALRVNYERFVEAPEEESARLMLFLGVAPVPGLSVAAFQYAHDRGPGDHKISHTRQVERDRVGRGEGIDLGRVPDALRERLARLLGTLGYSS